MKKVSQTDRNVLKSCLVAAKKVFYFCISSLFNFVYTVCLEADGVLIVPWELWL